MVIYLDIPESIRRDRLVKRKDSDDGVEQRLDRDRQDFEGFIDYDLRVTNQDF